MERTESEKWHTTVKSENSEMLTDLLPPVQTLFDYANLHPPNLLLSEKQISVQYFSLLQRKGAGTNTQDGKH